MALPLEFLEMLDAAERKGSFAAAVHELGRVPSVLAYAVHELGDDLDVLLFDRRRHRIELTPAGRALLDEGRHLLQTVDDLVRRTKRLVTGWKATLTIVVDDLVYFRALMPVIQDSHAEDTATRLRFRRKVLTGTWDALFSGYADLLVRPAQMMQVQDVQTHMVNNISFVSMVTAHHPLAQMEEPLPTVAIMWYRIIAAGDTSRNLSAHTIGVTVGQGTLVVPSMTNKVQAQIRGLGCDWLPVPLAQPYLDSGVLIAKEATEDRRATTFQVTWRNNMRDKMLQWWVDKLEDPCLGQVLIM